MSHPFYPTKVHVTCKRLHYKSSSFLPMQNPSPYIILGCSCRLIKQCTSTTLYFLPTLHAMEDNASTSCTPVDVSSRQRVLLSIVIQCRDRPGYVPVEDVRPASPSTPRPVPTPFTLTYPSPETGPRETLTDHLSNMDQYGPLRDRTRLSDKPEILDH